MKTQHSKIAWTALTLLALGGIYWLVHITGTLDHLVDGAALRQTIVDMGVTGPLLIMGLMVLAILISPIPSAPIAMAAGAAYGHGLGTLYVLLGAEIGALVAFSLARTLGRETLRRWLGDRLPAGWLGSQNALMAIVFTSRLLPFVSFDIVSYVAGLTALSFWRFAIATLAGIAPASFVLAHIGGEMVTSESDGMIYTVVALGLITLPTILLHLLRQRTRAPDAARK